MYSNYMKLVIPAKSCNEQFARCTVAAFAALLDPTIETLNDIKTSVSEAVTNSIVHAYKDDTGEIYIEAYMEEKSIHIVITDHGCGIEDIQKAMQPFYTTKSSDERSGMGFTVMQTFMDEIRIESSTNGTVVHMKKSI